MTDRRSWPYRPSLGLALIIVGMIGGAIGAYLTYRNYRTIGDNPIFSAGTILGALSATSFWTGFSLRRKPSSSE